MYEGNRYNIINEYNAKTIKTYYSNNYVSENRIKRIIDSANYIKKANSFLHVTSNKKAIMKSKKIYCSAGGLAGVIYTTPVVDNKIHNLGLYIIDKELPMFVKNNNLDACIDTFLIKINNPKIGYVDYLKYGEIYYDTYSKQYRNMIDKNDLDSKFKLLNNKIKEILDSNFDIYIIFKIMISSNVLKIFLFESILDYLFLFQKSENNNELNNEIVKNIIYELCPDLTVKFSLSKFNIEYDKLYTIVKNSKNFEIEYIENFIRNRIETYIKIYLLGNKNNFLGHIIFREFNLRKELERSLAILLWEESKENNYDVITYINPKGEMGVLPFSNYEIFNCNLKDNECLTKEKLNIKIENEILGLGIMRNPYK